MTDDRTEDVIVHLVDKHGEGEIEREYDNLEIVDEGWIRCIGPSHGGELDSGHVPVSYYPPACGLRRRLREAFTKVGLTRRQRSAPVPIWNRLDRESKANVLHLWRK